MRARGQEWERNSREAGRAEQVMLDYDGPQHPCGLSFSGNFISLFFFPYPDRRACDQMLFVCRRRVKTINVFNGAADVLGRWEKEWNTEQCTVHLRLE